MSRIIPVLDVLHGRAVHARGGRREDYRPLESVLRRGSDPIALARALRDDLGFDELYLADLDAIEGGDPALGLFQELARSGLATWIDAGLRDETSVRRLLDAGVTRAVAGSETLAGSKALARIVELAGAERVAFSLDLREGRAIVADSACWTTTDPQQLIREAVTAGFTSIILLDVSRVGTNRGPGTIELLKASAANDPRVEWVVGGGVAGPRDVESLWRDGASAVLVGSAIHDGRMVGGLDLRPRDSSAEDP